MNIRGVSGPNARIRSNVNEGVQFTALVVSLLSVLRESYSILLRRFLDFRLG